MRSRWMKRGVLCRISAAVDWPQNPAEITEIFHFSKTLTSKTQCCTYTLYLHHTTFFSKGGRITSTSPPVLNIEMLL